jgi:hypothetical protein
MMKKCLTLLFLGPSIAVVHRDISSPALIRVNTPSGLVWGKSSDAGDCSTANVRALLSLVLRFHFLQFGSLFPLLETTVEHRT